MKQKYTISIADVEVNVIADGSQEQVEYIVGIIDRKMRDILLRSRQCPKIQAALLCALEMCGEKLQAKEELESLKDQLAEIEEELNLEKERADRAERANINAEKEKARLEIENAKLRTLVEAARIESTPTEAENTVNDDAPTVEEAPSVEEAPAAEKPATPKKNPRSRVGSMFDLLTFSDI